MMDRKLETMFDMVTVETDSVVLDSSELNAMLAEQRNMTMRRIASWIRNNGKIFQQEWDYGIAKELSHLADDLDHLASVRND